MRTRPMLAVMFACAAVLGGAAVSLAAISLAPAPVILRPSPGAFVRGAITVEATPATAAVANGVAPTGVATPGFGVRSGATADTTPVAALSVDGGLEATLAARPPWRFALATGRLTPGGHVIGVATVEPTASAEATRQIVVDNAAPTLRCLTPLVRVAQPGTSTATLKWSIRDVVTTRVGLSIRVTDAKHVLRRAHTTGWATRGGRTTAWTFDGRDYRGRALPRGVYTIGVGVTDTAGNARAVAATSTVVIGGLVVAIDAGHQAMADPKLEPIGPGSKVMKPRVAGGATGVVTHNPESAITLAVALRLEKLLKAKGLTVVMIRRSQNVDIANSERAKIASRAHADLFVRIHLDGVGDSSVSGTSMQYPAANKWTKPIAARSKVAAAVVERALVKSLGLPDRGLVARNDLSGFNWCTVPAILPEIAFLSNPHDDRLMASAAGQNKAARGLAAGITEYLSGLH